MTRYIKPHVHKYIRDKLGWKTKSNKKYIYKCAIPGCSHYLAPNLVEGKFSICWRCGDVFCISKFQLRMKKPHCISCTKKKQTVENFNLKDLTTIIGDV